MNNERKYFKNIILVSGTGRNVGKTTFICQLLDKLSSRYSIVALKISPHRHELDNDVHYLLNTPTIQLVKENSTLRAKDSSRMLQAGAHEVFYLQARDTDLIEAFAFIEPLINKKLVVCESAALDKIIQPSYHIVVTQDEMKIQPDTCDIIANNQDNKYNFEALINRITVKDTAWFIR